MWLAILLSFGFAVTWDVFPVGFAYDPTAMRGWTWAFAGNLLRHWFLPFASLFLVFFGGWAIGMRNMIIYELESDYSHYLQALGAPNRLVRRYAFRNAVLPQVSGLALQLGAVIAGALVTEIVYSYPGLGYQIYRAITNEDYFVIQGIFLFIIVGVLLANFLVDIAYVIVDPRTRLGMEGGRS
jgi:peptide/nickel transport system permease protein